MVLRGRMGPITVVIADHQDASRAVCVRLLKAATGIRVVGEARSDVEALASIALKPRVVLLNPGLSPGYSVALLRALRKRSPRTKVLLVTRGEAEAAVLDALSHDARGYLDKRALRAFLPKAVRAVDAGEAWVPRRMVTKILDRLTRLTTAMERSLRR